ncbi:MAG: trypsin-like peptidase domain-containing protein [Planctomycetes bacterium]|nr:trypsin-like peptidase domain-containing protein [Planctomycetota bacterium]
MIRMLRLLIVAWVADGAQDAIPEKTLKEIKEATVFVKVDGGREWAATGSGFLMKRDGNAGYVVTNAHVIAVPDSSRRAITIVFAGGTRDERSVSAAVVGEDESRDLAILKVELANLPKPIDLSARVKLRETLPVYIVGFPFGEALSTNRGNPAVTIGRGSISSIRLDDYGEIARIQIDGDLNPGNSGGPIVDAKGTLVGVAVAKISGTQIGLAIPPKELEEMLQGRVRSIAFEETENREGTAKLKATAELIDPMRKMKSVSILLVAKDRLKTEPKPDSQGFWGAIAPDMREYPLKIAGDGASAEIVLKGDVKQDVAYLFQTKYVRGDGVVRHTQPGDLRVDFSRGTAAKPDGPKKSDKDDWLGSEEDKKKREAADAGKPVETGELLAGEKKTVVDATATRIKLDGKTVIPNLRWSGDGKFVFVLEQNGVVRKIAVPEFKEERQFRIGRRCGWIDRSKEGLLVLVTDLQELWVLDDGTLSVKKKIAVGTASLVVSSPALSAAFAAGARDTLSAVDVKAGKVAKEHSAYKISKEQGKRIRKHTEGVVLSEFGLPAVTPDGKYLFCVGFECLHRFKIGSNGLDLTYEEMGPRIGQNPWRIEISADSKYVCLPSGGGNYNVSDHPKIGSYGTYIYKVTDLLMPVISISSGAYPRTLAFDKDAGRLYAQSHECQLITFTVKGLKEKEYPLTGRGDTVRQFLLAPGGSKLLVLTDSHLTWVELPK